MKAQKKLVIHTGETVAISQRAGEKSILCFYLGNAGAEPIEIELVPWKPPSAKLGWRPNGRARRKK